MHPSPSTFAPALLLAAVVSNLTPSSIAQTPSGETFAVTVEQPEHGTISIAPALPEDGRVPAGTRLTLTATPAPGYALDSGYYKIPGRFGMMAHESPTSVFTVTVDRDKTVGASFVEADALRGFSVKNDIEFAQPGVKKLKYDVYTPDGARSLPAIIIVHGGGWTANDEDIMRGLARELVRGGRYVVASVDYRWLGTADGDATPNSMGALLEDVYGAIAHFQEFASSYGADPTRLAVTGDSAGGHLAAAAINLVDRIGEAGFGKQEGVYEFKPTFVPEGKSVAQVRREITAAIKAAAPSYGVFSDERLAGVMNGESPEVVAAVAPIDHIPPIAARAVPQYLLRGTQDRLIAHEDVQAYADALKAAGQRAEYVQVEGAGHAFFDWKPDSRTKATFARFGVPYAARMKAFFDSIFYPEAGDASRN